MRFMKKISTLITSIALVLTTIVPISADSTDYIVGGDRYETAALISDRMDSFDTAILVNSDNSLADGLSASSLAGMENAPILLVKKNSIPKYTLSRLLNVKKVYIIGGTSAISKNVEKQLSGKKIIRIEGKNRIETSQKVAKLLGNYNKAFIVNGNKGEADAMSVASVAARDKAPIILTNGKTTNHPKKDGVDYYAIGGKSVVSDSLVSKYGATRLSGVDRYKTNRIVVQKFYKNATTLYYTKGDPLVDALTVSSLAKNHGVVLVSKKSDNTILKSKKLVQVGGMNFKVNLENSSPVITTSTNELVFSLGENVDLDLYDLKATDREDGDLTNKISLKEYLIMCSPSKYKINLSVTDSGGMTVYKTLTAIVVDDEGVEGIKCSKIEKPDGKKPARKPLKNSAPVITSVNTISIIEKNQSIDFSSYGIVAKDKEDGDLTSKVIYKNLPDTSIPGRYEFIATVTDKEGLSASIKLEVLVREAASEFDVNSEEYQRRINAEFDRLLEAHRIKNGKHSIRQESKTMELARLKSKHMSDLNYFEHEYDDSKTQYYKDRWRKGSSEGYKLMIQDIYPEVLGTGSDAIYTKGENIFKSNGRWFKAEEMAKEVFETWVNSPGHNANLLSGGDVEYYGFNIEKAPYGTIYATFITSRSARY